MHLESLSSKLFPSLIAVVDVECVMVVAPVVVVVIVVFEPVGPVLGVMLRLALICIQGVCTHYNIFHLRKCVCATL